MAFRSILATFGYVRPRFGYVRLRSATLGDIFGGGLGDGRDFVLFMGRAGCAAGSGGEQIAWNNVTRHAVKDAEFAECQR